MILSRRNLPQFLLILIVVIIAYGQTLFMYFWQDDSALIFKLQNQAPDMGSFGPGIIGNGPYKYLVTPFVPFFPIFGEKPFGYFLVGLFTYLVAALVFWMFSREFFKDNKRVALVSTLFFAAGYVGSDIMFRIINSWQTNIGHILNIIALWQLTIYLRTGKLRNYLLSLFMFWASVEFVYVRSHSFIFSVFALDLMLTISTYRKLVDVRGFVARQIPFWVLFVYRYLINAPTGSSALSHMVIEISKGNFEYLASFFANIGNGIVPMQFQEAILLYFPTTFSAITFIVFAIGIVIVSNLPSRSLPRTFVALLLFFLAYLLNKEMYSRNAFWYRTSPNYLSGALGLYIVVWLLTFSVSIWRKYRLASVGTLTGLAIFSSQIFGYYIQYPEAIFGTTHRYFSNTIVGYSFIWAGLFAFFLKKYKKSRVSYMLLLVLVVNLFLGVRYQAKIVKDRSNPSRDFYRSLLAYQPEIYKGALFYFDVKSENYYIQQFRDFFSVGSMPESTALAMYYKGIDRDEITMANEFDELVYFLAREDQPISNTFTFYYGENGLTDTTDEVRVRLMDGSMQEEVDLEGEQDIKTSPVTPVLLTVHATVGYYESKALEEELEETGLNSELPNYTKYLAFERDYFETATSSSESEWRYQEHNFGIDGMMETSWRGHRIYWHNNSHDSYTVDLKTPREIGKVVWINWTNTLTPTSYSIETSLDGNVWTEVFMQEMGEEKKGEEVVQNDVENSYARFVRMNIEETLSNDAPSFIDFIPVPSEFETLDYNRVLMFKNDPFSFAKSPEDFEYLSREAAFTYPVSLVWKTDKNTYTTQTVAGKFDEEQVFEFLLPAGGTHVESVRLTSGDEFIRVVPARASIRALSLDEIIERGAVRDFSKN